MCLGVYRQCREHTHMFLCCLPVPCPAGIMQGYFLKLLGSYRSHIYADGTGPGSAAEAAAAAAAVASGSSGTLLSPRSTRSPRATGTFSSQQQQQSRSRPGSARGDGGSGRHTPSSSMGQDEALKGHGFWLDHSGMVASHRWVGWCGVLPVPAEQAW
jgi:hypothetical protein